MVKTGFSKFLYLSIFCSLAGSWAHAEVEPQIARSEHDSQWQQLKEVDTRQANQRDFQGKAFLISGALLLGASIPGFYLSKDLFAQGAYSVGENLGIAAVGYGGYLWSTSADLSIFVRLVDQPDLSAEQKERLARDFVSEEHARNRRTLHIRALTHGLTAGLNALNAVTTLNTDLRLALGFLGLVNLLAAGHLLFLSDSQSSAAPGGITATVRFSPIAFATPSRIGLGLQGEF